MSLSVPGLWPAGRKMNTIECGLCAIDPLPRSVSPQTGNLVKIAPHSKLKI